MTSPQLISAICTPLRDDHSLHVAGLEAHVEDQWQHGIGGLLVGGTMGMMQLQSDRVYCELVERSVRLSRQRGEIMVGVGDTCFARTRDRIQLVERFAIDVVVVLCPYLVKYSQEELIDYFRALAGHINGPHDNEQRPSNTLGRGVRLRIRFDTTPRNKERTDDPDQIA